MSLSDCLTSAAVHIYVQVLVVLSALSTVDPGDIMASVKAAAAQRTRVSVVGVAAQVHICETLTKVLAFAITPSLNPVPLFL